MKNTYYNPHDAGVYIITNNTTGSFYVGSSLNIQHRWWNHRSKNNSGCTRLSAAIKKYGKNNFTIQRIFCLLPQVGASKDITQKQLWQYEQYFIDSLQPFGDRGYNVLSSTEKGLCVYATQTDFLHVRRRAVDMFSLQGEFIKTFDTVQSAAKAIAIFESSIVDCCQGRKKSAGDFMWCYHGMGTPTPYTSNLARNIAQYDTQGKLIAVWPSITSAAETLFPSEKVGTVKSNIVDCCKRNLAQTKLYTARKFVWRYL